MPSEVASPSFKSRRPNSAGGAMNGCTRHQSSDARLHACPRMTGCDSIHTGLVGQTHPNDAKCLLHKAKSQDALATHLQAQGLSDLNFVWAQHKSKSCRVLQKHKANAWCSLGACWVVASPKTAPVTAQFHLAQGQHRKRTRRAELPADLPNLVAMLHAC